MGHFLSLILCGMCCFSAAHSEDISLGMLGWEKTEGGDHKAAIALFLRCIEEGDLSKASLARTYRNIGIALRRDERPKEAVDYYDKALALKTDDQHMDYVNRGNAWSEQGEWDKALSDYDTALRMSPDYNEAYYNRGIVFERKGMKDEAVLNFKKAYEFGLRSKLLRDRFVAYGLLKE